MRPRILVTGGAGYIGSHSCKALAAAGYEPVVYDNLSEGHRWAVNWGPLVVGDLADRPLLMETIRRYDVQAVMHFAAHGYVGESVEHPRKYFENNVANTLTLVHAMLDTGVRRLVFPPRARPSGFLSACRSRRTRHSSRSTRMARQR